MTSNSLTVLFICMMMILSSSSPEKLCNVVCLNEEQAVCCPNQCSEKCHSNTTFERATCSKSKSGKMSCIVSELKKYEDAKVPLKHCLNNITNRSTQCNISKAYKVNCNNHDLNKQGLWKAPETKNPLDQFQNAQCHMKNKKLECADAGRKPIDCGKHNCGFNQPLGEGDICHITAAYDVVCMNIKNKNPICKNEAECNWKAPLQLTFQNASCRKKDDNLECRDVEGKAIHCKEHQECGFTRNFMKDDICYIAKAYSVDCKNAKEPTCCQEKCDWKAPLNLQFNNASCQMKDKLECRDAEQLYICENYDNCGFKRFLRQDEICHINQCIIQETRMDNNNVDYKQFDRNIISVLIIVSIIICCVFVILVVAYIVVGLSKWKTE